MAWLRQSHEIKQDIRHVEERLAEIAESQSELSRNSQEIKDLTAKIVKTLNAGVSNDLLVRLISDIESVPSYWGFAQPAATTSAPHRTAAQNAEQSRRTGKWFQAERLSPH